jgi:hypothetical protein
MRSLPRLCWSVIVTGLFLAGTAAADEPPRTADATAALLPGCPAWLAEYRFPREQFTFVRIKYTSQQDQLLRRVRDRGGRGGNRLPADWGRWATDYPDADINLAAQLQRHTSLKVDPEGKVLRLTDPELSKFPFIYLVEPGGLVLSDEEVTALRTYLLEGGFLMLDDFWGEAEWKQFAAQIQRVFPDREFQDLPLDHKIFHCVFDLQQKPQVPSIAAALAGRTTERNERPDAALPGTVRRRRPDDAPGLPQHRPGRRLGTRIRECLVLPRVRRQAGLPDGHQHRVLCADAVSGCWAGMALWITRANLLARPAA